MFHLLDRLLVPEETQSAPATLLRVPILPHAHLYALIQGSSSSPASVGAPFQLQLEYARLPLPPIGLPTALRT